MKPIITVLLICIALSGCTVFTQPTTGEVSMPKTVALMPFSFSPDKTVGQLAADQVALEMVSKGYDIIDRSLATAVVNESKFYGNGLNEENRKAFQNQNIPAVLFGNVNRFGCETAHSSSFFGGHIIKNRCSVSLTAKIAESSTGKLLWGITISDSAEGENMTPEELMISLIRKAGDNGTLPAFQPAKKAAEMPAPKTK